MSDPMPPAGEPSGSGGIGRTGPVLALVALAAGVVLVHDAVVGLHLGGGTAWAVAAARGLRGLHPQWWLALAGLVAVVVGLVLVITALRPRTRRTVPVAARTGVYLGTRDVARLATAAAERQDGVLGASSAASRRRLVTTVRATSGSGRAADEVRTAVRSAVEQRLAGLAQAPTVTVVVRTAPAPARAGGAS